MPYSTSLLRLQNILNELREKCPWDKKQTIHTLQPQTIEEIYELTDAIQQNDWNAIKEELGDLLLHLLFYIKIADENKAFNLEDVIQGICTKLVQRHPHIYENVSVKDEKEVKNNWEKLKLNEGKVSIFSGVPKSLPPFNKSIVIQRKAQNVGFDWNKIEEVWDKINEETNELKEAIKTNDLSEIQEEYGDLLFSMINLGRFLQCDPERSIELCNQKFITRFQYIEKKVAKKGGVLGSIPLNEMEQYWQQAKIQTTVNENEF